MLIETINQDIKQAMLSKDKLSLESLRAIKTALTILNAEEGVKEITKEMEIKTLQKLVKQRREAAEIYKTQNRDDLAINENSQADVIEKYLPEKLSIDEIKLIITNIINELGATSIKDMGKVIGATNKKLAGQSDGKTIADLVKQLMGI